MIRHCNVNSVHAAGEALIVVGVGKSLFYAVLLLEFLALFLIIGNKGHELGIFRMLECRQNCDLRDMSKSYHGITDSSFLFAVLALFGHITLSSLFLTDRHSCSIMLRCPA